MSDFLRVALLSFTVQDANIERHAAALERYISSKPGIEQQFNVLLDRLPPFAYFLLDYGIAELNLSRYHTCPSALSIYLLLL